jgi:hypothetical protein
MYRLSVHDFVPAFSSSWSRNMTGSSKSDSTAPKSIRTAVFTLERYVTEVLMRDLIGHDHLPSAFLVYLFFRGRATADEANANSGRRRMHPVTISVRELAAQTGLAKSVVQTALKVLHRRALIRTVGISRTGRPAKATSYQVLRPWRRQKVVRN